MRTAFLEWPSKLRVNPSLYSKPIFEIVPGLQRSSGLDNDQATTREGWDGANHSLFSIFYFTTSGPAFSVARRFEGKARENGVGHGQDAWAALRKKFDGCSREALRAVHQEMKTVKMWSDEDPDDFLYKKDQCHDRLNSVTPKEGPSDRRYEDIILQCLPPEYDRIRQTYFERGLQPYRYSADDVEDLRPQPRPLQLRLVKRFIGTRHHYAGDGAGARQHRLPLLQQVGHYKNDYANLKAFRQQNQGRRQR